jgi:hypothetical protein
MVHEIALPGDSQAAARHLRKSASLLDCRAATFIDSNTPLSLTKEAVTPYSDKITSTRPSFVSVEAGGTLRQAYPDISSTSFVSSTEASSKFGICLSGPSSVARATGISDKVSLPASSENNDEAMAEKHESSLPRSVSFAATASLTSAKCISCHSSQSCDTVTKGDLEIKLLSERLEKVLKTNARVFSEKDKKISQLEMLVSVVEEFASVSRIDCYVYFRFKSF